MKRVAFYTFGCRLNSYDTETIRTLLETQGGWTTVPAREDAEVYVVNTCSVTTQADARARKAIRRINTEHPHARIVVTGCYAQRAPEDIAELPGVSLILGAADRGRITEEMALMSDGELRMSVSPIDAATKFLDVPITEMMERSRALVKIQEGCDLGCTFCIVPQTRGRSRSRRPESVLEQVRALVDGGYTEIVLTGVHIGSYGLDLKEGRQLLSELIGQILEVPGLERFRLSSIEPSSVSESLIELMASEPKFARHFHIPMQSASDTVLEQMRRGYTAGSFMDLINRIASKVPDCGIGTDVIAGFPGETDADFDKTFDCLTDLPITYLHPFTYSPRPGSEAERLGDQVPGDVKKRRTRSLKRLSRDKNTAFRARHVCAVMMVLLEFDERTGVCKSGLTDNYLRLELAPEHPLRGLQPVRVTGSTDTCLIGEVVG